jgi:hypothetical protein
MYTEKSNEQTAFYKVTIFWAEIWAFFTKNLVTLSPFLQKDFLKGCNSDILGI